MANKDKKQSETLLEYQISGITLIVVALVILLTLFLPTKSGYITKLVVITLKETIGYISYLFPFALLIIGTQLLIKKGLQFKLTLRIIAFSIFFVTLFPAIHLISAINWNSILKEVENGYYSGGGLFGAYLLLNLILLFGYYQTIILLLSILSISSLLIFGEYIPKIGLFITDVKNLLQVWSDKVKQLRIRTIKEEEEEYYEEKEIEQEIIEEKKVKDKKVRVKQKVEFPPATLLKFEDNKRELSKLIKEQKEKILQTLTSFGIEGEILEINSGPRITRYEFKPSAGIKVREIVNLSDDLALHLAAAPVRIEAPIPGKEALGIEVPNKTKQIVYLKELLNSIPYFSQTKKGLFFPLGKDIAGENIITNLVKMPHLLISGATGSGKSVCINSIITTFLYRATPEELKFLLIDPKRVELTLYNDIPHLLAPVVTDPRYASKSLQLMVDIMEERYDLFVDAGVRNIESYNEKIENDNEFMPYIIVIIDELADLMFQTALEVEKNICRLAQLSRATGIHLIIATQRPSVNVVTGLIKANIPSRISFAVSSQVDSRTILDMPGAERLLGEGDMLFLPVEASKPVRIQGAFVSEEETKKVCEYWRRYEPAYDDRFLELKIGEKEGSTSTGRVTEEDIDDELLDEAISVILREGKASASLLQRKLKIGYARAGRLIDIMEQKGIVGQNIGSKPREILIGKDCLPKNK